MSTRDLPTDINIVEPEGSLLVTGEVTIDPDTTVAVTQSGDWTVAIETSSIEIGTVDQGTAGSEAWLVDSSGVTQPISAVSLPLPTGASTSANQTTANSSLSSIDNKLTAPLSVTGPLTDTQLRATPVPVSTASLPLPSGAATSANQTTEITSINAINTTLGTPMQNSGGTVIATQATGSNLHTVIDSGTVTATVSGSVTANAGTNLNTSLLALDSTLTNATQKTKLVDTGGSNVASVSAGGALKVDGSAAIQPISAAALPLPPLASTSTLQTTGNTSLSSIDTKTPALGQALAAASVPVVLTAAQISTLTPLTSVTVTQGTGTNLHTVVDSGSITANAGTNLNTSALALDATITGGTQKSQIVDGSGNILSTIDLSPATQNITVQDVGSSTTTGANGQVFIIGNATAGSTAAFSFSTRDSGKIQVTGVWTGTLVPEVSFDGGTIWFTNGVHQTGSAYTAGSFTSNFAGGLNLSGVNMFRIRATTAWTGTATIRVVFTTNTNSVYVANGLSLQDATVQSQKLAISSTGAASVSGSVASGASDTGNPVKIGGIFNTTQPTVTNAQRVDAQLTNRGAQIIATGIEPLSATVTQATGTNLHTVVDSGTVTTVSTVTNLSQLAGNAISMNTGVRDAGTQRVTIATNDSVPVTLAANQSVNNAQIAGTATSTSNGTVDAGTQRVAIASNNTAFSVNASGPTLTKGTQGSTGFSVQDLKDAGRNQTNYYMAIQIVSTATDALMSLTGYKAGAAVVATTTPAVVTAAKTYRINSITMNYTTIITTPGSVRFTLRANTGGVVAIGSPAVCVWEVGEPTGIAPVAGKKNTITIPFPDGMEFAAGTGIGISMVGLSTIGAAAVVGYGQLTLNGFEY